MMKTLKSAFKFTTFVSSVFVQLVLFGLATVLIFTASYVIGYHYLLGDSFFGNDSFSFYTIAYWIDKYYPNIPFWFPLQGGGISFTGYPWFAAYIINIISHNTSLNLAQSFRFLGFLSIPLTGVGIFVLVWARLTEIKPIWLRQIVGIVASLFYAISPVSWIWLMQWGFYAEQVSLIFIPWIILFFDLYLDRLFKKQYDFLFRLGFVGAVAFFVLGSLTHFFVLVTSLTVFVFLGVIKFTFQKENRLLLAKRLFFPVLFFFIAFTLLFAFRYYPYSTYMSAVQQGGLGGSPNVASDREGTARSLLTPKIMLSLDNASKEEPWRKIIQNMRFPFYVWLLVFPSLILSAFISKRVFAFSLFTLIGFLVNTNIDVYTLFSKMPILGSIPFVSYLSTSFLGRQFFVQARILTPIAAAFGAYVIWEFLFLLILKASSKNKLKYLYPAGTFLKPIILLSLFVLTVGFVVYRFYNSPYPRTMVNIGALESEVIDAKGQIKPVKFDLRDIWGSASRPGAIGTANYTQEQEKFVNSHPEYVGIADYIYLHYLCAFIGPSKPPAPGGKEFITKGSYPPGHICRFYVDEKGPPKNSQQMDLFPEIDDLMKSQKHCRSLSPKGYVGVDKYCIAFYPGSILKQLAFNRWPQFTISPSIADITKGGLKFFDNLPKDKEYRYDISGYAAKTVQSTPIINNNSQMQMYIGSLSLIYNSWNYLGQVMYTISPLYQKPGVLTELGKWFGLDYVFLSGTNLEPQDYWRQDDNWVSKGNGWREFKLPTGLVTWDQRPKILVISDNQKFFYDQIFKFLTRGGLLYDQGIPIKGEKEIDRYSLSELKQYDIIFMQGYSYRSRSKAYSLLDKYVKDGGKLIFDTGWQFFVPDYELQRAPEFMPFKSLSWKNLDKEKKFQIEDLEIAGEIDPSKFGPLIFENSSWGVSVPGKVREWAKTVLSFDNESLAVVGQYGKGKVAWLGFNLISHSEAKDSVEEVKFFNRLIKYLNGEFGNEQYPITMRRISPDHIEITLNQTVDQPSSLYFRESFYPDWKATFSRPAQGRTEKLQVKSAGPGFIFVSLPQVSKVDKLELKIKPPLTQRFAEIISFVTFLGLLLYLFFPRFLLLFVKKFENLLKRFGLRGKFLFAIQKNVKHRLVKISGWDKHEEEDY